MHKCKNAQMEFLSAHVSQSQLYFLKVLHSSHVCNGTFCQRLEKHSRAQTLKLPILAINLYCASADYCFNLYLFLP